MVQNVKGGHSLELKDTDCENQLKFRGGKTIFEGRILPLNHLKNPAVFSRRNTPYQPP